MSSQSIILARIKKNNHSFEISVNPDRALEFKQEKSTDIQAALEVQTIFSDAKKGLEASQEELQAAFNTTNVLDIAKIIITQGELQLTAEHRKQEREKRRKQLVHMIHINAIDPKTDLPHPPQRIEAALEQAKVNLVDHKPVEQQFDEIISKLRPIIPIKIAKKILYIVASAKDVGQLGNYIRSNLTLKKEEWTTDGHWATLSEAPAGLVPEIINMVNKITGGDASVDVRDE